MKQARTASDFSRSFNEDPVAPLILAFDTAISYFVFNSCRLPGFSSAPAHWTLFMPRYTPEEIRAKFANSADFNELFDAFEEAISQRIQDVELYRLLFWNHSLGPDELCLFGEKLSKEFPGISYDIYMWLASVFEVTYSSYDNFELAIKYYRKAAEARPRVPDPYLDACDCYDPDLNIPPVDVLLEFLKSSLEHVSNKKVIFTRLSHLYRILGDEEQSKYYRDLAEESDRPKTTNDLN
jgi:hypothetical protein